MHKWSAVFSLFAQVASSDIFLKIQQQQKLVLTPERMKDRERERGREAYDEDKNRSDQILQTSKPYTELVTEKNEI